MYVGRIVAIGQTKSGNNTVVYRVSSRSFPNRMAVENLGSVAIVPRPGHEGDIQKNPYIAYNALRVAGDWAVATNGTHTDPIAEKIASGLPVRDAMTISLLALDYERDELSTPRIAAAVHLHDDSGWLAIVRRDALVVKEIKLTAGTASYIATYEADDVRGSQISDFDASTASDAALFAVNGGTFAGLEKPVTSAAALSGAAGFNLGIHVVTA